MPDTKQATRSPHGTNTAARPTRVPVIAKWLMAIHAGLLVAQPLLAGVMLDAMSAGAQQIHHANGMLVMQVGLWQVVLTYASWKGRAGWPRTPFILSLVILLGEGVQFIFGLLRISMAVHIPLGVGLVGLGVWLALKYARRDAFTGH